jgi:hypothetical protein
VTLGAFVIWSEKNVAVNTAHVVVGALTLATSLVLTLRSYRARFADTTHVAVHLRQPMAAKLGPSGARA